MNATPSTDSSGAQDGQGRQERLVKALFDNVSHELKTPLTVISVALDQPELDRAEITQAVRRLHRTIENFLTAARLDAGEMQPYLEWCDPGELTHAAVASIAAENHAVRVTTRPDLPFIFVDASFVERALGIILANAISNSTNLQAVELAVTRNSDSVVWTVLDRGPTFAPGDEIHAFSKFYRGTKRQSGGLGLGLFIAKQLAELLGGTLAATNRNDRGACFALRLPIGKPFSLPDDIVRSN